MSDPAAVESVSIEVRSEVAGVDLAATVAVTPPRLEVGLPFRLVISLAGRDAGRAEVAFPAELGAFSVRPVEPGAEGRFAAELVTFDAGPLEIPAIPVLVDEREVLAAGPVPVESVSLRTGEFDPANFHGIRGEVLEPAGWSPLAIAAVATTAVLVALGTFLFFRSRRPRPTAALAPHEWALSELDRLAGGDLVARGEIHGFFVHLSDIVRGYVERRFGLDAPDRTTREFLDEARRSPELGDDRRRTLESFLREADLVKFAGARPDRRRCDDALALAREFVIGSIRADEPAPTAAEAPR